ncbi:hypothetical protein FA15DRAFT_504844 [Coprinopsis marcescibilis]|uniref:Uncharacterized protein n=1 Tax=Coprinopsis marcescibilis TaxID=230819 RepID=A0A5C3KQS5_COPMA|nr:hypothetical protein FA15DRAFT_504844 [Coprinopsis marcescibilis]
MILLQELLDQFFLIVFLLFSLLERVAGSNFNDYLDCAAENLDAILSALLCYLYADSITLRIRHGALEHRTHSFAEHIPAGHIAPLTTNASKAVQAPTLTTRKATPQFPTRSKSVWVSEFRDLKWIWTCSCRDQHGSVLPTTEIVRCKSCGGMKPSNATGRSCPRSYLF